MPSQLFGRIDRLAYVWVGYIIVFLLAAALNAVAYHIVLVIPMENARQWHLVGQLGLGNLGT